MFVTFSGNVKTECAVYEMANILDEGYSISLNAVEKITLSKPCGMNKRKSTIKQNFCCYQPLRV